MSWKVPVFSSHVAEVGFDDQTNELIVVFQNGKTYHYEGVDEETAVELSKTASVGGMLNDTIKGQYKHRKVG